jgi:hypothetical protein
LDSTLLDDAVATQDTVTQLVAAIRRVRRLVPAAGALSLAAHDDDQDPGKPACAWDDAEARDQLVSALVTDALAVLAVVQDGDLDADQAEAVGLLGLVAGQDVEPARSRGVGASPVRWRPIGSSRWWIPTPGTCTRVAAAIATVTRPTWRWSRKRGWSVRPRSPRPPPLMAPAGWDCWPPRHQGLRCLVTPPMGAGRPGRRSADQADPAAAGGAGRLHPRRLHRRPPGQHRDLPGRPHRGHHPQRPGGVRLALWPCPLRERCTRAKDGKTLTLGPHEAEVVAARRRATTPAFQASYRRWRPMVERSIAWLVAGGHRRVRYRGLARNQHGLSVRVAAINLRRLVRMGLDHHDGGWVLA